MLIKYIVVEDGDDQNHPNAFRIESETPRFSDVMKEFPIPGQYHFRILKNLGGLQVWWDILDPTELVPTSSPGMIIKASRIKSSDDVPLATTKMVPVEQGSGITQPISKPTKPVLQSMQTEKLLKFDDGSNDNTETIVYESKTIIQTKPSNPAPLINDDNDLLGFNSNPVLPSQPTKASSSADLFGLETLQPTVTNSNSISMLASSRSNTQLNNMFPAQTTNPSPLRNSMTGGRGPNIGSGMGVGGGIGMGMGASNPARGNVRNSVGGLPATSKDPFDILNAGSGIGNPNLSANQRGNNSNTRRN